MTVSLIRKGKRNIPENRIINLLQINGNHVCYIMDLVKFLKSFMNLRPPYPFLGYVALNLGNFGQNEIISFLDT